MTFEVPYSSSPAPSTPDRKSSNGRNLFAMSNPSTTPAGPPPSSAKSFTPAGLPPSSVFGSSMMDTTSSMKPLSFSQTSTSTFNPPRNNFESPGYMFADSMRSTTTTQRSPLNQQYQSSPQRGFQDPESEYEDEDSGDYMQEDDTFHRSHGKRKTAQDEGEMLDQEPEYEEDDEMDDYQSDLPESRSNRKSFGQRSTTDLVLATPGILKRSRGAGMSTSEESIMGQQKPSMFEAIARDLFSQMRTPEVTESGDLILTTESVIAQLYEKVIEELSGEDLMSTLTDVSEELLTTWSAYAEKIEVHNNEEYVASIGPGTRTPSFMKANFIAELTLQLHHPPPDLAHELHPTMSIPQVLLIWMARYHDPFSHHRDELLQAINPAKLRLFWDTMFSTLLRGYTSAVTSVLRSCNWRETPSDLGFSRTQRSQGGYSGQVLANVEKVVLDAANILELCPAANQTRSDWNVSSSDWTLFRLRVSQAIEDLKNFAEGREANDERGNGLGFGRSSMATDIGSYSRNAQKAGNKIPWNVYQNLMTLYSILVGDANAIIESAQDWCEATVGLLIWWDDKKDDRRAASGRSRLLQLHQSAGETAQYFHKLRKSFELATEDSTDFQVNSLNPVEVALASVFENDHEAVVGFLRGWSGPISSAVAEIAAIGGWLPAAEPQSLITMGSLDQDDLDLLGISSSSKTDGVKDQALITYAESLSNCRNLWSSNKEQIPRAGWEIAIAVLGRLDSAARSEEIIGKFLKDFELDSSAKVDKVWIMLRSIGMDHHAESTVETYADHLADGSHNYGEAMWYYALAHKTEKVKDVLDLLISLSLVNSTAYPAMADLDDYLKRVISAPKKTLVELSRMDVEAAELLRNLLSGYATLRKFYDLRDEEVLSTKGAKSRTGAASRKAEAAAALLTVISSADDNIRGGLYDEERGSIVSVDFLLALLGESMMFVNQPNMTITVSQIDILLKATENLQVVGPRVYNACAEFLATVIASGQDLKNSAPSDMLRKSTSDASGNSSFSMVGSSMLASKLKQSMSSSGIMVGRNMKRGWDWRRGLSAGTSAHDVLSILRLGLAKDLAQAWLREADGIL
ncbi:hypothetical protein BJ875DRAFT_397629 [Amylocarpus encephaloides]|uniref:Nuclear pore complex protein Nup85 n=1 Tax=Amylocarpus encephaloides TaxID=45428 RepID=A0A9P8C7F5_9HELO|nr:hypothetical protein BJ875DRAFT_397629 [Amylocarpus encephaloides]